ncbi:RNA ligase [Viscerimonas tarda]
MIKSAGLVIIHNKAILLVKQKGYSGKRCLSIPKGCLGMNESIMDAAIRETYEETSVCISKDTVRNSPYLINYYDGTNVYKQIFYFVLHLSGMPPLLTPKDNDEIEWAKFVPIEEALKYIFIQQFSIFNHLNLNFMIEAELEWLLYNGFIKVEKHPFKELYIYNYTDKCKEMGYWNETTLRCRGLILDNKYQIIASPMKKFFEYNQLYQEFLPRNNEYEVYEKLDGALGILYWINGLPFITTRSSFVSPQAYKATLILYRKYFSLIKKLSTSVSYYFEIIYPAKRYVIDYGKMEDIILLGAYDNKTKKEIPLCNLDSLGFKVVKKLITSKTIDELLAINRKEKEGFVVRYKDGFRIKIKFDWYKNEYANRFLI